MNKKLLFICLTVLLAFAVMSGCEDVKDEVGVIIPESDANFATNIFHQKHNITQCSTCHLDMSDNTHIKLTDNGQLLSTQPNTELRKVDREVCLPCHSAGEIGYYQAK